MKRSIIKYIGVLGLATAAMTGCTDKFDSINTDPTAITECVPGYILPYMQQQGTRVMSWEYQVGDNLHTNLYAQYFSNGAAYFNSDSYTYKSAWVTDGFWTTYYVGVLKQARQVAEHVKTHPEFGNIYQIMRIFTARCTAQTTDIFGDIPYTEGATGISNAKYDNQKDIYAAIFKELSEASAALTAHLNDASMAKLSDNQDLIYNGDLSKWVKLANSLRLRYALRLSYVDAATAKREGEAALKAAGGLLSSNADNAGVYITGTGTNGWPLFQISGWGEFCMSKTMEDMLKTTSTVLDPRTTLWFGHTQKSTKDNPEFKGIPNGLSTEGLGKYAADERSFVWGAQAMPNWNSNDDSKSSYVLGKRQKVMDFSEVCFLKAEAALKGWSGAGAAKDDYLAGIQASFDAERAGVDAALYTADKDETYKTTGSVAWDSQSSTEGHLKQIITQKWLALYPDGVEAWSEFRRTGYPVLMPVATTLETTLPKGTFVKKLRYVDDELRENPNAKNAALNGGKGDGMNVRVWWDTGRYK
uniref:SusD/RagB family nutrient-binding outer membrane lipoprotein n=1 Tax=Prevotella sp. GTC17259 TaxID=3236795 RepID=A0AB33J6E3_9BACT